MLRRSPRSTAAALAILALGIGANTAMFSAINHVLLRPLPFHDADRLMRLRDVLTGANGEPHPFNMSSRSTIAVRESATAFDAISAMSSDNMTLTGNGLPERVSVVRQTDNVDRTIGVMPILGRGFTAAEEREGERSSVALVSHSLWQTRLGGQLSVLGSRIQLDSRAFTIVGVMPAQYTFPYQAQVWIPHVLDPADQSRDFAVWARLKPGMTVTQARESLDAVAAHVRTVSPATTLGYSIELTTIRENLVGEQDAPLRALTAIVLFLLLIACVNVATLLLACASARRREFAVRAALGASRGRHIRQLLVESLVLATMGCLAGLLLASWMAPLTSRLMPDVFERELGLVVPQTDWRVATFAVAASLLSAILAGMAPALSSWRSDPQSALHDGGRAMSGGPGGRRILGALVIAETALTLVLLVGAALVIRHFVRLQTRPLGIDIRSLLTMELVPPVARYTPGAPRAQVVARIVDEMRAEPGVVRAAATTVNPLGGGTWAAPVITEDAEARDPAAASNVNHRLITPGLFAAMGIPLLRGRDFSSQDRTGAPMVVIVSDRMARRYWPNQDPIGKRVRIARPNRPWLTVVGVAADVSDSHFPGVPLETWYVPFDQHAETAAAERVYLMVRSATDPLALVQPVRRAVARVDEALAPYDPVAMDTYYSDTIGRERVGAAFMLGFGTFGLALAALGVYGVIAFAVGQRSAEFGIRIALGATVRDILPLVLERSAALVGIGVVFGSAAAAVLNRMLAGVLSEIGTLDGRIVAGAALLILTMAAVACLVPALSATRVDPVSALRAE